MTAAKTAREIKVFGIVQGVGFRPFVYRLAQKYGLTGWVLNSSQGVTIHWEGGEESISRALRDLLFASPPLARVTGSTVVEVKPHGYSRFFIQESHADGDNKVLVPPDVGVCSDCLKEVQDAGDRRYRYPFTNCTNCGPRFTIIKDLPYDRRVTTMNKFTMCSRCRREYEDPGDRRFHAQPNACPDCGPQLRLVTPDGRTCAQTLREVLQAGAIVAVKGLGGYHLACNALDARAVRRLRRGKVRDAKPFALMAADLETVRRYCYLSGKEEEYLVSPARPIVVLRQREENRQELPAEINPNLDTLGMMLPYTPLHWLLFAGGLKLLVMTSANLSGDPLITENEEALRRLKAVADYFLIHDRDIENPCDDSVGMVVGNSWQFVRRARGYVPLPVTVPRRLKPLLACGPNLKNTFALAAGNRVFLSQHFGDLDSYLNYEKFREAVPKMRSLLGITPELVAHDMHPGYQTTAYARELAGTEALPLAAVQHHHAHMASCMADNGLDEPVLAVVCDGTGYGPDGTIWGFEFLYGDYGWYRRKGHLACVPLPGGDAAIKRPDRMAYSFLVSALGSRGEEHAARWLPGLSGKELEVLAVQLQQGINTVPTSSCGRLFDGAAALMGICHESRYEGQGPMEMEARARKAGAYHGFYPLHLRPAGEDGFVLDSAPLWEQLVKDRERKVDVCIMACKFHHGVARGIRDGVLRMSRETGLDKVVLSGGVFQNRLLTELVTGLLEREGLQVYRHRQVPPNDGGISLGQSLVGNEVYMRNVSGSTP